MRTSILAFIAVLVFRACLPAAGSVVLNGQFCPGTGGAPRAVGEYRVLDSIGQFVVGRSVDSDRVIEHGFWHSYWLGSIDDAKNQPDGTYVGLCSKVVTAGTNEIGGGFYVEEQSRASGIRILWSGSAARDDVVTVRGIMRTASDFERYVEAASVSPLGTAAAIEPLGLTNRDLGGGDFNYDPINGAGQRGLEDAIGLNNIGLLVRTSGTVTAVGPDFFYIDDGTNAQDYSIFRGIRVLCPGISKPVSGQHVSVTGISSISMIRDRLFRAIRPRVDGDIQVN